MRKIIIKNILIGVVIAITFFVIWGFSPFGDFTLKGAIGEAILILLAFTAAGLSFYVTTRRDLPLRLRRAWGLLALGESANCIAEIFVVYIFLTTGGTSLPSLVQVFYLMAYPFVLAGILSLPYTNISQEQRRFLIIDILIIVLVCASFLWYFIIANLIEMSNGLPDLIAIAYPIGDLTIFIGIVSLIQRDVEGVRRSILLALGLSMLFFVSGDILYAILTVSKTSSQFLQSINFLLFLMARMGAVAAAAWQSSESHIDTGKAVNFSPLLRTNLVFLAVLSGMGITIATLASTDSSKLRLYGTISGTFGTIWLVLLRQHFTLQVNDRLKKEVEHLAVTDSLTGISNRRFFDDLLAREIAIAQRYSRSLSVLMIDVNDFKKYNDQYGHLQGDWLLREIAQLIKKHLRAGDVAARYGGDEFAVILPETNLESSKGIAERLCADVTSKVAISISVGSATFQLDMTTDTLLALADQDMYLQKRLGKGI